LIIRQPFASLIAFGKKRWEFRSYDTSIRGNIGIVASHKPSWASSNLNFNKILQLMPKSRLLATAELVNTFYITRDDLNKVCKELVTFKLYGHNITTFNEPVGEPVEDVEKALNNKNWESFVWILDKISVVDEFIIIKRFPRSIWVQVDYEGRKI
jgi:hypothetical protein